MSDPATLLVADDDPGLRESLERTLVREGYRVVVASDGHAALERLRAGGVDLVLTDLKMPGLSGIEVLRMAKSIAPDVFRHRILLTYEAEAESVPVDEVTRRILARVEVP